MFSKEENIIAGLPRSLHSLATTIERSLVFLSGLTLFISLTNTNHLIQSTFSRTIVNPQTFRV